MLCEVTVKMKNDEKSLSKKFLVREDFKPDYQDPIIKELVDAVRKEFRQDDELPTKQSVTIKLMEV